MANSTDTSFTIDKDDLLSAAEDLTEALRKNQPMPEPRERARSLLQSGLAEVCEQGDIGQLLRRSTSNRHPFGYYLGDHVVQEGTKEQLMTLLFHDDEPRADLVELTREHTGWLREPNWADAPARTVAVVPFIEAVLNTTEPLSDQDEQYLRDLQLFGLIHDHQPTSRIEQALKEGANSWFTFRQTEIASSPIGQLIIEQPDNQIETLKQFFHFTREHDGNPLRFGLIKLAVRTNNREALFYLIAEDDFQKHTMIVEHLLDEEHLQALRACLKRFDCESSLSISLSEHRDIICDHPDLTGDLLQHGSSATQSTALKAVIRRESPDILQTILHNENVAEGALLSSARTAVLNYQPDHLRILTDAGIDAGDVLVHLSNPDHQDGPTRYQDLVRQLHVIESFVRQLKHDPPSVPGEFFANLFALIFGSGTGRSWQDKAEAAVVRTITNLGDHGIEPDNIRERYERLLDQAEAYDQLFAYLVDQTPPLPQTVATIDQPSYRRILRSKLNARQIKQLQAGGICLDG